jgi:hypothetical protein
MNLRLLSFVAGGLLLAATAPALAQSTNPLEGDLFETCNGKHAETTFKLTLDGPRFDLETKQPGKATTTKHGKVARVPQPVPEPDVYHLTFDGATVPQGQLFFNRAGNLFLSLFGFEGATELTCGDD